MAMGAGLDTSPLRVQLPPQTDAGGHGRDRGSGTAPACRSLSRHHCALARSAALNSPCAASSPAGIKQTKQLLPISPNQKTPQISMYRLHVPYQYKNIHKLYRSQLSRSKYNYKSQYTGEHQTQGGMESPQEHGTPRVHPSMGWQVILLPRGVTSYPDDSTGTWTLPWPQSGGGKVQISPLKCAPSLPFPTWVWVTAHHSQCTRVGRAGCAQGQRLHSPGL